MKKTFSAAVALSVLAAPAIAANLENPLYMPKQGAVYSKTSAGVMYKIADDSNAHQKKNHDGATEFPIWRIHEELGYGILDNLEAYAKFGYTHDGDIDRKGMHLGRAGLKYRAFESTDGFVWDVYADAQLGGISEMSGAYTDKGFNYDNYSNGRWGFHVGTQVGKTWSKLSVAGFAEVLRTFGNDNNSIDITQFHVAEVGGLPITALGFPDEISVDLKSATEVNAGLKAFYQLDDRWSFGAGFTFKHHADNGVEGLASDLEAVPANVATQLATMMGYPAAAAPIVGAQVQEQVLNGLLAEVEDMEDGFDEYILSLSAAYQMTDAMQVAVYGEYTFDESHPKSQNGTDVKAELGVRLNVQF
ncbi:MAG: hypothetical protein E7006_03535 [Alphaproteobacteria bacterium]|nr:hypothetical protein [Alphaproteobacteria bacterium]